MGYGYFCGNQVCSSVMNLRKVQISITVKINRVYTLGETAVFRIDFRASCSTQHVNCEFRERMDLVGNKKFKLGYCTLLFAVSKCFTKCVLTVH